MNEILYILMRNDLPSLNAGKAMAQASHASNQFVQSCSRGDMADAVKEWTQQTPAGFGTVLVLSASGQQISEAMDKINGRDCVGQVVVDPSYPYRTNLELSQLIPISTDSIPREVRGDTVNLWRTEYTCAFVFGTKEACQLVVGDLPLHP
jgi:peptidyl-tRNA hydrolase